MAPLIGTAFDIALAVLLLGVAGCSLWIRDLLAGVVLYIVFGLLIALAWVRLGAPDVALAEAAIGAGLTGVLLIGALDRIREARAAAARRVGDPP